MANLMRSSQWFARSRPTSAYLGAQAIVLADGTLHGWIGGGCAKGVVIGAAQSAIENGEPKLVRISNDRIYPEDDVENYTMSCASNGSIELFIQPYSVRSALCVLGNTPAADEARFLAERLRIRLTATPGEAPVVLVATQGQGDEEALEAALRSRARHVLMIASRRKMEKLRAAMLVRGIKESQLRAHTGAGGPGCRCQDTRRDCAGCDCRSARSVARPRSSLRTASRRRPKASSSIRFAEWQ